MPHAFVRMTLPELVARFDCDSKCRAYLEYLRWGEAPTCPKCGNTDVARVGGRESVLRCRECQQQFTVTVGTVFHDSHLPLTKWFMTVYLLTESKKGMSALQLKRMLGVGYKTAWYLCHRIRQAMTRGNGKEPKLTGTVEIDDTWIGGKRVGCGHAHTRDNKTVVVGMTERNGRLRMVVVPDLSSASIAKAVRRYVSKDLEMIVSDEFAAYVPAIGPAYKRKYRRIKHAHTWVEGDVHTNSIENRFSLLKRGIIGSWHRVSVKHLQRYLEEVSFRFSQRKNPALFSLTLQNLVSTDPITFKALTRPEEEAA